MQLRWFPIPEVVFWLSVHSPNPFNVGQCQINFPAIGPDAIDAMILRVETTLTAGSSNSSIKVFLDKTAVFDINTPSRRVRFEVVNFVDYYGHAISRSVDGQTLVNVRPGRVILNGGGWRVTLDSLENVGKVIRDLKADGGYGLTHTGLAERNDGADFQWQQFQQLSEALFDFLSFARGSWSCDILPRGENANGGSGFFSWGVPKLSVWKNNDVWFSPLHASELPSVFPGFMTRWEDARWQEAVRFAVHAYVESNSQSGSIESSIILGQITLELLSAAILVEEHGVATAADFNNSRMWPAMRKFRELLSFCGIPIAIPPTLGHLTAAAVSQGWVDGPQALTQTRNKIAHSSLPNLRKLSAITGDLKSELRTLTLWYVELVLLWWFNHTGGYRSRVDPPEGHVENPVPWAHPSPSSTGP
jgi:hypothetical protein